MRANELALTLIEMLVKNCGILICSKMTTSFVRKLYELVKRPDSVWRQATYLTDPKMKDRDLAIRVKTYKGFLLFSGAWGSVPKNILLFTPSIMSG